MGQDAATLPRGLLGRGVAWSLLKPSAAPEQRFATRANSCAYKPYFFTKNPGLKLSEQVFEVETGLPEKNVLLSFATVQLLALDNLNK